MLSFSVLELICIGMMVSPMAMLIFTVYWLSQGGKL